MLLLLIKTFPKLLQSLSLLFVVPVLKLQVCQYKQPLISLRGKTQGTQSSLCPHCCLKLREHVYLLFIYCLFIFYQRLKQQLWIRITCKQTPNLLIDLLLLLSAAAQFSLCLKQAV